MIIRSVLTEFDAFLTARNLKFEAIAIGGAALNLLGVIARETKDVDVLDPAIPPPVLLAAIDFARIVRQRGEVLAENWLNNGPASLVPQLPKEWRTRLQPLYSGVAITLLCLGREDLLRSKLFALCDRALDLADCVALAPTTQELQALSPWLDHQDANPDWPQHVRATLADLARRLSHGI